MILNIFPIVYGDGKFIFKIIKYNKYFSHDIYFLKPSIES